MGTRRRGRECALQLLFQLEAGTEREAPSEPDAIKRGPVLGAMPHTAVDDALDRFFDNFDAPERVHEHCERLVRGVMSRIDDVNALITKHSEKWRIERMALVDRNVLRIAAFELLVDADTPVKVVIDEAVEIAQRYGAEGSAAFVNGLLDAMARDVRASGEPA